MRSAPAATPASTQKPKPGPSRVVERRPVAKAAAAVARAPHDRGRVPLAVLVTADELDRGLLAVAGIALLLVALGGAVLLAAARRQLLLAALGLLALVGPAGAAAPPVSYTLVGTAGASGWHTSNVTVKWTVLDDGQLQSTEGCEAAYLITAEGTTASTCKAYFTWGVVSSSATVKIDKSAPTGVSGSLARAPDSDGWFNHPVAASFSGQDAVSGIAGCSAPTYSGVDSAAAALSGTCTDVAGNTSAGASVGFRYDATAPAVTPKPDRAPDHRGWYRKPLTVGFAGTDLTSGIASCTAPVRYAGPDLAKAAVVGSCRDRAGNAAEAGHSFPYDATAPKLARVEAEVDKGVARIGWERAGDVVQVELVRTPGINGAKTTTVYTGKGAGFVDRTVRPGVRYRYELSVADVAGNVATRAVTALERAALYSPAAGAAVRTPPVLRWQAVRGATFYNVQLFRGRVKVLSAWPRGAALRLGRGWHYGGKEQRLEPGLYRWYVWGARGTKERPTYGRVLGTSTFVVRR